MAYDKLFESPLSLPQGPAGFCTTDDDRPNAGAEAVKPPTQGRGRLKLSQFWDDMPAPSTGTSHSIRHRKYKNSLLFKITLQNAASPWLAMKSSARSISS